MGDIPNEVGQEQVDRGQPVVPRTETNSLCDLTKDYALFTTALINTFGMFDRDPVQEFVKFHPDTEARSPFALDMDWPVFQDIGRGVLSGQLVDWDRRLYGIVLERWEQLRNFIGSLSVFNRKHYFYARFGWHELTIVDPLAMHQGKVLEDIPMVVVTDFMVSSNRQVTYLAAAKDPPRTKAYPATQPPVPEIVREATAILGPPPNPEALGLTAGAQLP